MKFAPNFSVKVDLTNFPMRPILEIPNSVKEKIGDLNVILGSLRNWNEFHDTDVVVVLNELKACLGYYGYGKILISRSFVDLVYEEAIAQSTEIIGFLKMNRWIISELQMASGYYSAPTHAQFSKDVIPRDDALIEMVHSHPNGIAYPSHADMNTFRSFKINMIIAFPRRELKLFNDLGSGVSYEIVNTYKLDHGRKSVRKASTGSGSITNESKKDNDKMMYS